MAGVILVGLGNPQSEQQETDESLASARRYHCFHGDGRSLQSHEMKRHGEIQDFRPSGLRRVLATLARKKNLILSVVCMAVSFFAFMPLLQVADLSFAVPASAGSLVIETVLARRHPQRARGLAPLDRRGAGRRRRMVLAVIQGL